MFGSPIKVELSVEPLSVVLVVGAAMLLYFLRAAVQLAVTWFQGKS